KGGDDGLKRAAVGQQGDDADEQGPALVQAIKGGALGGGKGPAAAGTAEAPLLAGVNADVASAHLAPVRALRVVTECHRGVHGSPPFRSRLASLPVRMFPGPPFDYLAFRPSTVSWGAITAPSKTILLPWSRQLGSRRRRRSSPPSSSSSSSA